MKPALLLIDLQNDFLGAPRLEPCAAQIVESTQRVLVVARERQIPVVHVWTTVNAPDKLPDVRMPHWKTADTWRCVEGTRGHATPRELEPLPHESIVHKQFFSAFENPNLDAFLQSMEADTLILAGVHTHGCIRAAALDAYRRGYRVLVMRDAIGSDDPVHAAITSRYLQERSVKFISLQELENLLARENEASFSLPITILPVALIGGEVESVDTHNADFKTIVHSSPRETQTPLWRVPIATETQIANATQTAQEAFQKWKSSSSNTRTALLQLFAKRLHEECESLAQQMVHEIGKPIVQGRAEIERAVDLINTVISYVSKSLETRCTHNSQVRFRPLGVVAMVSPWNNPVAIPVGKIAPALFYGNALVWKPSPPASNLALRVMKLWCEVADACNAPRGLLNLICGDDVTARTLMRNSNINGVTMTGSSLAGYAAQEICATRRIPLQAELGGNNAAIIWHDCELQRAARMIAEGAFGFAGQRCTANRRVIVESKCYDELMELLKNATRSLVWGDPCDEKTQIGPMISLGARDASRARIERAQAAGCKIIVPHQAAQNEAVKSEVMRSGAYVSPTIVCCDDANLEIVQEESFAPILVVQRAGNFDEAVNLCNGVKQGLAAALFSSSSTRKEQFLDRVQSGILKINRATADANAQAPFGGWKSSGVGAAEHGQSNREFWTRVQTVYEQTVYGVDE